MPPPEWRHAVACCWEQHVAAPRVQRVVPDGYADVLLHESGAVEVVGVADEVALPLLPRGTWIRGVRVRPEAVAAAFGLPASSLTNATVAAEDLLGSRAARRLADHPGLDRWVRLIEPDRRTATATRLLASRSVSCTADALGVTPRQLRRILVANVGLAPKPYQRVLRLQRFLAGVEVHQGLAVAAAHAGYADQSHLTREVLAMTGLTPAKLVRERSRGGSGGGMDPGAHSPPTPAPTPSGGDRRLEIGEAGPRRGEAGVIRRS